MGSRAPTARFGPEEDPTLDFLMCRPDVWRRCPGDSRVGSMLQMLLLTGFEGTFGASPANYAFCFCHGARDHCCLGRRERGVCGGGEEEEGRRAAGFSNTK